MWVKHAGLQCLRVLQSVFTQPKTPGRLVPWKSINKWCRAWETSLHTVSDERCRGAKEIPAPGKSEIRRQFRQISV